VIEVHSRDGAAVFSVRVQPRASKDEIAGEWEGAVKIRLRAPAVENRANEALIEFLARVLRIPKSAVRIQGGERSRTKSLEVRGVTAEQVRSLVIQEA